ncbi:DUF262 domain-containing protein [Massilia sp. GCM10023247]|uniref:DUF262 domain-containing protein n=1 Tax=Massilia sp. GCM10023247 TaxID=3252643 RepID=UPI00361ECCE9
MTKQKAQLLKDAVDKKRREISSDNISMSIGELLNLYRDGELDIHPEFQRVFRWLPEQKSRLIESLLLGIPLPPIYVATNEDGEWEVIDGVQRLSTIFEFMGELSGPKEKSDELEQKPAFQLSATKHLPELDKMFFSALDQALRLEFKRTRLDVKVLSRDSIGNNKGKFDLFERLNTYGQPLSPQELRNCVLVSLNPERFRWLKKLSEDQNFRDCTLLSESQMQERYDMDLALRFLTLRNEAAINTVVDVHDFLRERMEEIALDESYDEEGEAKAFHEVFEFLEQSVGSDSFRSWNAAKGFRGGFSLGAYEGIAIIIGRHWSKIKRKKSSFNVKEFIEKVWSQPEYNKSFSGLRARERMLRVMPAADRVIADFLKNKTANAPVKRASAKKPAAKVAKKN